MSRLELQRAVFFALQVGERLQSDYFDRFDPDEPDYLITPGNLDAALEEMERDEAAVSGPAAEVDMDRYLVPVSHVADGGT